MQPAPLHALIIDDEPLSRQELAYLLERAGGVSVVAQGSNGVEAVELVRTHQPDVVFLDVRMPGLDGFAVLKRLMASGVSFRMPQVVFATAFDQYAVKAFEVNAVDYLLKPFDSKRLDRTLEKVRERVQGPGARWVKGDTHSGVASAAPVPRLQEPLQAADLPDDLEPGRPQNEPTTGVTRSRIWDAAQAKLDALLRMVEEQAAGAGSGFPRPARTGRVVVRTGNRLLLVDQKDVCFASTDEGRIRVVTKTLEGDSNVRTLEELADQLDSSQFWRAHRSYLVNLQHIREVVPWFKSSYQLRMDDRNGTEIPVSRSQTKRLRELFKL